MPIHFSIGFVAEYNPKRPVIALCAAVNGGLTVDAVLVEIVNALGRWPRENGCGMSNCGCGGCIERGSICIPRGDDSRLIVSVYDSDGDEFDISGATEIVFMVSEGLWVGGSAQPGGAILIVKKLSLSEITIAGTLYQFVVDFTDGETADLPKTNLYYEAQITTSAGLKKTVSAGMFKAQNTQIKDIP